MLSQVAGETWPSLLLQAGSFGLLAYIVTWMYPKAQESATAERERRDIRFEALVALMETKFETRNAILANAITKQSDSWKEEIREHTAALKDATKVMCRHP